MSDLSGRRVLITGSTRGIGRASAALFHARGAEVVVHGRKQAAVDATVGALQGADGAPVRGVAAELEHRDQGRKLAQAAGEVDILVNCAGVYDERPIADSDAAFWDWMLAINLTAPWTLAQALLPGLRKRRGVIVNVSSDAGVIGYGGSTVYAASKGALVGLTRALAIELAPEVRAVAICPGPVDTDMAETIIQRTPDPEATRRQWERTPMLRRMATAEEIAATIVFAASPAASYVTGAIISVDGGSTTGKHVP
jgi:NAD(P)-dependent dehydrogenase (short-subunit alcohol dehydrogenase family)